MTDRRVTILFTQEQYEKMNDALSQTIYKNLSQYIRETMEMISDLIISSDEMEVLLVTNERDNGSVQKLGMGVQKLGRNCLRFGK